MTCKLFSIVTNACSASDLAKRAKSLVKLQTFIDKFQYFKQYFDYKTDAFGCFAIKIWFLSSLISHPIISKPTVLINRDSLPPRDDYKQLRGMGYLVYKLHYASAQGHKLSNSKTNHTYVNTRQLTGSRSYNCWVFRMVVVLIKGIGLPTVYSSKVEAFACRRPRTQAQLDRCFFQINVYGQRTNTK